MCGAITVSSREVILTWTAPPLIDQNGKAVGYNLVCRNSDGELVNGLSLTRSSTDTMITITGLMPNTCYTCDLSFINVVGEGPSTQCTFKTAQDSK